MTLRTTSGVAACWLAATLLTPSQILGTTIHVSPDEQLGAALASAAAGDTVLVACGTYAEQGLQLPAGVVLRGETGIPDCVVLSSGGGEPILTIANHPVSARVEGITFTMVDDSTPAPVSRGAGLLILAASPQITNCAFTNLVAGYGGAIHCGDGAAPVVANCLFEANLAVAVGGAVNCVGTAAPTLAACLFVGNSAGQGGRAINAALGCRPRLLASTLADNDLGPALMAWDTGVIELSNCIVLGEAWTGDISAIPEIACSDLFNPGGDAWNGPLAAQAAQNGNISADPLFCRGAGAGSTYELDEASPCAEAATGGCGPMGAFPVGCAVSGVPGETDIPTADDILATRLRGNFPNPFNPATTIRYDLKEPGRVVVSIFDLAGRRIKELVNTRLGAGPHEVLWNGRDGDGRSVAAGVYFVQLRTSGARDSSLLSLIK